MTSDAIVPERTLEDFFAWKPPGPGERIVSVVSVRDFLVVTTDLGVYHVKEERPPYGWSIEKVHWL